MRSSGSAIITNSKVARASAKSRCKVLGNWKEAQKEKKEEKDTEKKEEGEKEKRCRWQRRRKIVKECKCSRLVSVGVVFPVKTNCSVRLNPLL